MAPRAALLVLPVLLATACASHEGLRPFTTDGCSLFPDRALIGEADWCECCVEHDRAYWRGGTADERRRADERFHSCVEAATGNPLLAKSMLAGVRVGGTPALPTHFRWGYGWPLDRGYRALTAEEEALVQRRLAGAREADRCSK